MLHGWPALDVQEALVSLVTIGTEASVAERLAGNRVVASLGDFRTPCFWPDLFAVDTTNSLNRAPSVATVPTARGAQPARWLATTSPAET